MLFLCYLQPYSFTTTTATDTVEVSNFEGYSRWASFLNYETKFSNYGTAFLCQHARLMRHQSLNSGIDSTHLHSNGSVPLDPASTTAGGERSPSSGKLGDSKFVLVTWNIDAMSSAPEARISAFILRIQNLAAPADIIFLQGVPRPALLALLNIPWLRENWYSGEMDTTKWRKQSFESMTFVSKTRFSDPGNAALGPVWRVNYPTLFERDALCCDVLLPSHDSARRSSRVRLINVHLDSLPMNPSLRPRQLAIIASYIRAAGHGLVAGDFNPVLPEDDSLFSSNSLLDAWAELHPGEDGFTWGVDGDAPFPPNRLDKVAMVELKACDIQIIPPGEIAGASDDLSVKWSDHSGLVCSFTL